MEPIISITVATGLLFAVMIFLLAWRMSKKDKLDRALKQDQKE